MVKVTTLFIVTIVHSYWLYCYYPRRQCFISLRTIWRLFQKSTAALTRDVIQPVLDTMIFPSFVNHIKITDLKLGESPALIREIARIPSRALNEAQHRFSVRLIGDRNGYIDLRVKVRVPGIGNYVSVPVRLNDIDLDAIVWASVTLVPYPPWIRYAQWAFEKLPSVKFSIRVAGFLPITSVPVLSTLLNRIVTKDVPSQFVFPKISFVDFMTPVALRDPDGSGTVVKQDTSDLDGVSLPQNATNDELRLANPKLSALFDGLDLNEDGKLDKAELAAGLIDWGFGSSRDREAIMKLLDVNVDGYIQLGEFLGAWNNLQSVFVPRRFRGVISGILLQAESLRTPFIGSADFIVEFRCEEMSVQSKRSRQSLQSDEERGCPVWDEVRLQAWV